MLTCWLHSYVSFESLAHRGFCLKNPWVSWRLKVEGVSIWEGEEEWRQANQRHVKGQRDSL